LNITDSANLQIFSADWSLTSPMQPVFADASSHKSSIRSRVAALPDGLLRFFAMGMHIGTRIGSEHRLLRQRSGLDFTQRFTADIFTT
jgi:hypothetical protein